MNLDQFREEMWAQRESFDKEAKVLKDSNLAWQSLRNLYQKFSGEDREMADHILEEWISSEDENVRYDALVLIGDFKVVSKVPALQVLATRLASSRAPSALYELNKVNRIIDNLSQN